MQLDILTVPKRIVKSLPPIPGNLILNMDCYIHFYPALGWKRIPCILWQRKIAITAQWDTIQCPYVLEI